MSDLTALVSTALIIAAFAAAHEAEAAPFAWAYYSSAVWSIWLISKGWSALSFWEKLHFFWAAASIAALCKFTRATLSTDDPFEGWGDIYFFCGQDYRYCNCNFTWNLAGWGKALVFWNFVVTASLGLQKLVIHTGLQGLLPGEEVVTKESLVSFCWRLIPYWLNSWEQQWGAECSSVMFELPHFALELLVVLPCVQIMASRLKILLMPPGRGIVPPFDQATPADPSTMAPVIMTGLWEERKSDHDFKGRIRANFRVLSLLVGISALAACNALYVPLRLEQVIHTHPRSRALLQAAEADGWLQDVSNITASEDTYTSAELVSMVAHFDARGCQNQNMLASNLVKHASEISNMQSPRYRELTMCVEAALTIMRLSCEQYFTLISVFAAYLLFRQHPPLWARQIIWINHRVSTMFKKTILYSFPAVCWAYGAGFMFSSFASLVFWGQPIARLYEVLRAKLTVVQPVGLQEPTEAQIEQMNGSCAVCWAPMATPGGFPPPSSDSNPSLSSVEGVEAPSVEPPHQQPQQQQQPQGFMEVPYFPFNLAHGQDPLGPEDAEEEEEEESAVDSCKALPCGHAFHTGCIAKWLQQCHVQSRQVTCPMCNLVIKLEVSFRLSRIWSRDPVSSSHAPQSAVPAETGAQPVQQQAQRQELPEGQMQHQSPTRSALETQQLSPVGAEQSAHHNHQSLSRQPQVQFLDDGAQSAGQRLRLSSSWDDTSVTRPSGQMPTVHQHAGSHDESLHSRMQQHRAQQQERYDLQLRQPQLSQQPQQQQQSLPQLHQPQQTQPQLQHPQAQLQYPQPQLQHLQPQLQHPQPQLQQPQHHAMADDWQPGLSTYQALERLSAGGSAQAPSFLRPSPPLLQRQSSDSLQREPSVSPRTLLQQLAVPHMSSQRGNSGSPSWRAYQESSQHAFSPFETAIGGSTSQMQHGGMTLSDRQSDHRSMSHQTAQHAGQGLLGRLLRTRRHPQNVMTNRDQER